MKIHVTDDVELRDQIRQALKDNEGFCPCRLEKIPENKCMCKEFLEQDLGPCHCGLYIKVEED